MEKKATKPPEQMNILFFISHQPNPRFIKQINFLSKYHHVTVLHFRRTTLANLDDTIRKHVVKHDLGAIPNASKPLRRLWVYVTAMKKIRKRIRNTTYDSIVVNNIDMLILYLLSGFKLFRTGNRRKIIMEISDLREFVFQTGFSGRILRFLEKKLYKKYVDKLIVTSKKYYTHHFKKFFTKDVFVLENKLLSEEIPPRSADKNSRSDKIVIGIVGLLLRKDEYIKLFEIYKDDPVVEIHIHGKGHYQHLAETYASKYKNIMYFGPYNAFTEAQAIYASIDIIYLVYDTDRQSLNNRLALPNKLYECMYYRVPLICSKDTYLEEIVLQSGIGASIRYKMPGELESAVSFLTRNSDKIADNFASLSQKAYLGDDDYKALASFLAE